MFEHYAYFNDQRNRVEMHLKSKKDHNVLVSDLEIEFKKERQFIQKTHINIR